MESFPNTNTNEEKLQKTSILINSKQCYIYYYNKTNITKIIYWLGDDGKSKSPILLESLTTSKDYALIGIFIENWNRDLSPWKCHAVFGDNYNNDFEGLGQKTFDWLINDCIPEIEKNFFEIKEKNIKRYIAGYSLAALFSLWVFYSDKNLNKELFDGACAGSPSFWFKDWDNFMKDKKVPENCIIYYSIGSKEGKTKNQAFKKMRSSVEMYYQISKNDKRVMDTTLEVNKGGHFTEVDLRMAKGFSWLIKH